MAKENGRKGRKLTRKVANKKAGPPRYLIVSEGEKTEVNYFNGIKKVINKRYGDKIEVSPVIEVEGLRRGTDVLVKEALKKSQKSPLPYEKVWCVFDKDLFADEGFNRAIHMCEAKDNNLEAIWSNESFELWFVLHFQFLNSPNSRDDYVKILDRNFKKLSINNGIYEKNIPNIYEILSNHGDQDNAIKYAKKLEGLFVNEKSYAKCKPVTKVHGMVEELEEFIKN